MRSVKEALRREHAVEEAAKNARQHPGVWADIEKPFWGNTPVWLASSMLESVGIAHNHLHRAGVLDSKA